MDIIKEYRNGRKQSTAIMKQHIYTKIAISNNNNNNTQISINVT